ncbi:MAG: hypothetical protein NVS4B11_21440 [Ktedonobacteraceae bacterium]
MKHPTDDMLLAYVRQQQRHLWPQDIQEHIAICPACSTRYAEFRNIGNTIEAWTRTYASDPAYAMVSNRVLQKLSRPKPSLSQRVLHSFSEMRTRLSVVAAAIILCFALLTGLAVNIAGKAAGINKLQPTQPTIMHIPTVMQQQSTVSVMPSPTVVPSGSFGATATSTAISIVTSKSTSLSKSHITTNAPCTTIFDVFQDHLRVCGTSFTPGSTVTILYIQAGNRQKSHTTLVGADGTFIDTLFVHVCKDVPTAIYVQSTANPSETAQILKNIAFGDC